MADPRVIHFEIVGKDWEGPSEVLERLVRLEVQHG